MNKKLLTIAGLCLSSQAALGADSTTDSTVSTLVSNAIGWLEAQVFGTVNLFGIDIEWIVLWMGLPMIALTLYFGFVNLRSFGLAAKIIRGDYSDKNAPGEVSQFQALTTALSGTVGLGNIAGAAVAISIGGPGATFWMIVIGLFAMSLKFAECTLGVKYRLVHEDGTISGGPMYYLERGLAKRGWRPLGRLLALAYAILALFTLAQLGQVNQSFEALSTVTGVSGAGAKWGYGTVLAILTATVIVGGIKSIAKVTSRLVPLMAAIYLGAALVIILGHIDVIPNAFATIFREAWRTDSAAGGIVGVIVIAMRRAVYSTEAGLGSATMAHAAAKTNEPVSEGLVALLEPFIDTVVISTITALVIVISGVYLDTSSFGGNSTVVGVAMTSAAFGSVISWFPYVLALAAFLFAFSTIISWGYYCGKIWSFLFGSSAISVNSCKLIYCLALIPGAVLSAGEVFALLDSLFFLMAIPNLVGIYIMAPEIKADLKDYLDRMKISRDQQTVRS